MSIQEEISIAVKGKQKAHAAYTRHTKNQNFAKAAEAVSTMNIWDERIVFLAELAEEAVA